MKKNYWIIDPESGYIYGPYTKKFVDNIRAMDQSPTALIVKTVAHIKTETTSQWEVI